MSYCRFGEADVYVFASVGGGVECCGCPLQQREYVEDDGAFFGFYLKSVGPVLRTTGLNTDEIMEHLEQHRAAGHHVPDRVFSDLEADRADNDMTAVEHKST